MCVSAVVGSGGRERGEAWEMEMAGQGKTGCN